MKDIRKTREDETKPGPLVLFKPLHEGVKLPVRNYASAGFDLFVHNLSESGRPNKVVVPSHAASRPIPCGFAFTPPAGYLGLVCSRSGLAQRGLFVANAPGVVDPDYTGELKVILYNGSHETAFVHHGDRIAQLLFVPFLLPEMKQVSELPDSLRGEAGFGSTGLGAKEDEL